MCVCVCVYYISYNIYIYIHIIRTDTLAYILELFASAHGIGIGTDAVYLCFAFAGRSVFYLGASQEEDHQYQKEEAKHVVKLVQPY